MNVNVLLGIIRVSPLDKEAKVRLRRAVLDTAVLALCFDPAVPENTTILASAAVSRRVRIAKRKNMFVEIRVSDASSALAFLFHNK